MNKIMLTIIFLAALFLNSTKAQDTFSIVAVDTVTGEVGSAGASCIDLTAFPEVEEDFISELYPGYGAANTQAWYEFYNQIYARNRINDGKLPSQVMEELVQNDAYDQPELRQYGIVTLINGSPKTTAYTGAKTEDYKNHIIGRNYVVLGNILSGPEILDSMEANFNNCNGDLAHKLMAAMQGANKAGADTRCTKNGTSSLFAFLKLALPTDPFGLPTVKLMVRTKDGGRAEPIDALQIKFDQYFLSE